jgi:hypothetical protein
MRRWSTLGATACLLLSLLAVGCGGDDASTTTSGGVPTTTAAGTTFTTAPGSTSTTVAATTATTGAAGVDLTPAVMRDGDPWPEPVVGAAPRAVTGEANAPTQPEEGYSSSFRWRLDTEDWGRIVSTTAFRFTDETAAQAYFAMVEEAYSSPMTLGLQGLLVSNDLDSVGPLEIPALGDQAAGLIGTGSEYKVLFVIWRTGNILQYAYASMPLDDEEHAAALIALAETLAARVRSG